MLLSTLKELAHNQIHDCCQTLCVSSIVTEYIEILEKALNSRKNVNRIQILGRSNCKYCKMAISLLETNGIQHVYIDAEKSNVFNIDWIRSNIPEAKTFPIVFFNGVYIGGYDQLKEKLENYNE